MEHGVLERPKRLKNISGKLWKMNDLVFDDFSRSYFFAGWGGLL
jgi:hypothetical protein